MKKTIVSTKRLFTLVMMMVITVTTNAMSFATAKHEALFLSDKMAWELNLTNAQYEDVYEINLDYLMSVNGRNDAYGSWWKRRNTDLKYVLTAYQYEKYVTLNYFYRPLTWKNGSWTFNVYSHYTNKNRFYKSHPKGYISYKGGNNKKSDRYYADRKATKPTSTTTAKRGNDKNNKGNGSTWRNTSVSAEYPTSSNREVASNTTTNSNRNSHFGSRR